MLFKLAFQSLAKLTLMSYSYFRKMARHINVNCDFSTGYLVYDIPRDTIKMKIKIKSRWGKPTLTDDKERRMKKFHPWRKCAHKIKISTARKVVTPPPKKTHDSGSSLDSEMDTSRRKFWVCTQILHRPCLHNF